MHSIVPKLHDLVGCSASRTVALLRDLGVEPSDRQVRVVVVVGSSATVAQRQLATTLVDMVLRLDPLVAEVIVDAADVSAMVAELTTRLPMVITDGSTSTADFSIGIGTASDSVDMVADAAQKCEQGVSREWHRDHPDDVLA